MDVERWKMQLRLAREFCAVWKLRNSQEQNGISSCKLKIIGRGLNQADDDN